MSNGRQIEGWAISRKLPTQIGNRAWGFFEDYETANTEAARFDTLLEPCEAVPATLILPSEKQDADDAARDGAVAKRSVARSEPPSTDPLREEMARALEALVRAVGAEARREDHVNWAMQEALAALSKHRDHAEGGR